MSGVPRSAGSAFFTKPAFIALTGVGSVDWASSRKPKRRQLCSDAGHLPGLRAGSPARGLQEATPLMFLSHIRVSLPLFLPSPLSKNK